jgi:hypothetical protein
MSHRSFHWRRTTHESTPASVRSRLRMAREAHVSIGKSHFERRQGPGIIAGLRTDPVGHA